MGSPARPNGFHLDQGETAIGADDNNALEQLAQFFLRAPISLQKMPWNAQTKTVLYRSSRSWPTKRNFESASGGHPATRRRPASEVDAPEPEEGGSPEQVEPELDAKPAERSALGLDARRPVPDQRQGQPNLGIPPKSTRI